MKVSDQIFVQTGVVANNFEAIELILSKHLEPTIQKRIERIWGSSEWSATFLYHDKQVNHILTANKDNM